jgi:(2R)-sulfolactate sulfo-lyase subunit alpha
MAARHKFLVHEADDMVGVAVEDVPANSEVEALIMDNGRYIPLKTRQPVPLGHKVALRDIPNGARVIKYGVEIGEASADIKAGDHVHVQNLQSLRWKKSVARA